MLLVRDIMELSKRMKKDACTITRMCGCYVDNEKNKLTTISERFLNMQEEEFFKYLDIAKEVFSKKVENNMLDLEFREDEKQSGGMKQFFQGVVESKLKNNELLDALYDRIIETFPYAGNYLILVYHDAYDVMKKAADNKELDESEEVYEYILVAICPVTLTAPGLEYKEERNCIGPRERDWVVQKPDTGFIYPAFKERSAFEDSIMYYASDASEPGHIFMEDGLRCKPILTAVETREIFENEVFVVTQSQDLKEKYLVDINEKIYLIMSEPGAAEKRLDESEMLDLLRASKVPEVYADKIASGYAADFEELPLVSHLFNSKAFTKSEEKRKKEGINDILAKAARAIEGYAGEETELTEKIWNTVGRNR